MSAQPPSYEELRTSFRWELPAVVNIGVEVADRHPRTAPAILVTDGRELTRTVTYGELAEAFNVVVCPHFLMEIHVSLVAAVPNGRYVEHIPQLRAVTTEQLSVVDGHAVAPDRPGLGIAWDRDQIDARRVA